MTTSYFSHCEDVAAIKAEYKKLAMRWHPDRPGGSTVLMQEINAAYKKALSFKHGEVTTDDAGKEHTYYYKEATEQAVIDKITEVMQAGVLASDDVELWLIGTWLWIKGNTRPHRTTLGREGLKFSWNGAPDRQCWQWHLPTGFRTQKSADGFESIARKYGGSRIAGERETALA
jgi:hypothetical protein